MNTETFATGTPWRAPTGNELVVERLHKLQKEIRRIKRLGIGVTAALAALILLYRPVTHRQVSAQEFVLTDALGRVRARLAFFPDGPGLEIYGASGEPRVHLVGGGEEATLNLYIPVTAERGAASVNFFRDDTVVSSFRANPATSILEMHSAADGGAAFLSLQGGTASLTLSSAGEGTPKVSLETNENYACATLGGAHEPLAGGSLCLHAPGLPALELTDLKGNRAVLGIRQTADLATGGPPENSAASLALQHKSGKSLHLTPR
jgi:hypothetical protein